MTTVYHELLPHSYLLLLTPEPTANPRLALAHHLRRACRSGKPAVWVDCELVPTLTAAAARTLCACHARLQKHHMKLVVVHASDDVADALRQCQHADGLCFAPTLFAAAWHTGLPLPD